MILIIICHCISLMFRAVQCNWCRQCCALNFRAIHFNTCTDLHLSDLGSLLSYAIKYILTMHYRDKMIYKIWIFCTVFGKNKFCQCTFSVHVFPIHLGFMQVCLLQCRKLQFNSTLHCITQHFIQLSALHCTALHYTFTITIIFTFTFLNNLFGKPRQNNRLVQ